MFFWLSMVTKLYTVFDICFFRLEMVTNFHQCLKALRRRTTKSPYILLKLISKKVVVFPMLFIFQGL